MAFVNISAGRYAVGAPVTTGLLGDIVTDLNYLNGVFIGPANAGGAPLVLNGSFESPLVATSTTPDNWTLANYTDTAPVTINTDQNHGAQALQFTRASGASKSGGTATSTDFFYCSPSEAYRLEFMLKCSNATLHVKVQINWYTAAQSFLSTTDVYNTSSAQPTSWKAESSTVTPPATAMFGKIILTGGDTDVDPGVSATVIFDGLSMTPRIPFSQGISYTSNSTFTIPSGVFKVKVVLLGSGTIATGSAIASGGYCEGIYNAIPGENIAVTVDASNAGISKTVYSGTTFQVTNHNISVKGTASGGYVNITGGAPIGISSPVVVLTY